MTTCDGFSVEVWSSMNDLHLALGRISYKPGWTFRVGSYGGINAHYLGIQIRTPDSSHPENSVLVDHQFSVPRVPDYGFDWKRWIFERVLDVERHEACEFFQFSGGRPYYPEHGVGSNPYKVAEVPT